MKFRRWLEIVFDHFIEGLASLAGVILIFLMLLIVYEVVMRYVFKDPAGWSIEVSEYTMLFIVFLGTSWLMREGGHVRVDIVYDRLNPSNKLLVDIIASVLGAIVFLIVFWFSTAYLVDNIQRNILDTGTLKIPKAIPLSVLPVGFFALTVEFIRQAAKYMIEWISDKKGLNRGA